MAKLEEVAEEVRSLRKEHNALVSKFEDRGKNHEKNNETFKEIAIEYNRMFEEKNRLKVEINEMKIEQSRDKIRLQEEVNGMKVAQAVQQSNISMMLGEIVGMKDSLAKVVSELVMINTSINNAKTRDKTIWGVVILLVQSCAPTIIMIATGIAFWKGLGKL